MPSPVDRASAIKQMRSNSDGRTLVLAVACRLMGGAHTSQVAGAVRLAPRGAGWRSVVLALVLVVWSASGVVPSIAPAMAAPGSLDTSYGHAGVAITPLNQEESFSPLFTAVAIGPGDEVIAAGTEGAPEQTGFPAPEGEQIGVIAKYRENGNLDSTFGNGGLTIGRQHCPVEECLLGTHFTDVTLSGEKIVAVGGAEAESAPGLPGIFVARFNANGTPDTTFGNQGNESFTFVGTNRAFLKTHAQTVVVQADGKILVGGTSSRQAEPGVNAFMLRLNTNGSLDSSFNGGTGIIEEQFSGASGGTTELRAMALQPADGSIVIAGAISTPFTSGSQVFLARITSEGQLDKSFGRNGVAKAAFFPSSVEGGNFPHSGGRGVAVEPDGDILVAGSASELKPGRGPPVNGFIARFSAAGELDPTYGEAGSLRLPWPVTTSIALTSGDDAIVAAARFPVDTQLAAFLPSGAPDPRFVSSLIQLGVAPETGAGARSEPFALALDSAERIVIAGLASDGNATGSGAAEITGFTARFVGLPPGPPPPLVTTGGAGGVTTSSASITGGVNPEGPAVSYHFEYGLDQNYGLVTATQVAAGGTATVGVGAQPGGLSPATTYHYRLVATGPGGTSYGGDASFQTGAEPATRSPAISPSGGSSSSAVIGTDTTALPPATLYVAPYVGHKAARAHYPVIGCHAPNSSRRTRWRYAPQRCETGGSGTLAGIDHVRWHGWGSRRAIGDGSYIDGLGFEYPATITAYELHRCNHCYEAGPWYGTLHIIAHGGFRGGVFRGPFNVTVNVTPQR
jgi:uncharacterized delta-60 repeat protein